MESTVQECERHAATLFGVDGLWESQRKALESCLSGQDTCIFLSTGAGKSLIFQLAAVWWRARDAGAVMVVLCPFQSLIEDQCKRVNAALGLDIGGKPVVAPGATPAAAMVCGREADRRVRDGAAAGQYALVFVTPESLFADGGLLDRLRGRGTTVAGFAVDEAHHLLDGFRGEHWGKVGRFREIFPKVPTLALTATADATTRAHIDRALGLRRPTVVEGTPDRLNVTFAVRCVSTNDEALDEIVRRVRAARRSLVFCTTTRQADSAALHVRQRLPKHRVGTHHSKLLPEDRAEVERGFVEGRVDAVVATSGFGEGIHRPDVSDVVVWGPPFAWASFVQFAGRAGRDGSPARCTYVFRPPQLGVILRSNVSIEEKQRIVDFGFSDGCRRRRLFADYPNFDPTANRPRCCDVCDAPGAAPAVEPATDEMLARVKSALDWGSQLDVILRELAAGRLLARVEAAWKHTGHVLRLRRSGVRPRNTVFRRSLSPPVRRAPKRPKVQSTLDRFRFNP